MAAIWLIRLEIAYGVVFTFKFFWAFVLARSSGVWENYPKTFPWYMYVIHIILKRDEHFSIAFFIIWNKANRGIEFKIVTEF